MNSRRRAGLLLLATAILGSQANAPFSVRASHSDLVISQVYGGGGNSGATFRNDFIELFNRGDGPLSVDGMSVQYASSAGATWQRTNLTGVIAPGEHFLVQEAAGTGGTQALPTPDAAGSIAMSATSGKVALVSSQTPLACGGAAGACLPNAAILDLVGYGTAADNFEGTRPTANLTNTTAALRLLGGCTDADDNGADFATGGASPRNRAATPTPCNAPTNPFGRGAASPASVGVGDSTLLTVAVTPGTHPVSTDLTVVADLTPIGGPATQTLFDDGTNGDATAGDLVFSFVAVVAGGTGPGNKTLVTTVADAQLRSGSALIALGVLPPPMAVHDVQGNGRRSPFEGQTVRTSGIVTARRTNGFFLQTPDGEADADPGTSEGVFVFTGSAPPDLAAVGNAVSVSGRVSEFVPAADPVSPPLTEISGSPVVSLVSVGHPLPAPVELSVGDFDPAGDLEQLERFEGMRVHVASFTVVAPTQGFVDERNATSTSNGLFYGVVTGLLRPFREAGVPARDPLPAGSPCCIPRFDENPERLRVDSDAQPGAAALEVTAGTVLTDLVGPLDFGARTYTILPDPATPPGVTGLGSAVPVPAAAADEFTVASFNLERFFDDQNDPAIGEPVLTSAAYANRLSKASLAIRNVLRAPDVLGVIEVESLEVLETLARRISTDAVAAGQPDPGYRAFLIEGSDPGGIDVGLLVGSRVSVRDVTQEGRDATFTNPDTGQQDLTFDRPPLVARVEVAGPVGPPLPLTVVVNHLRSLIGIDDPVEGRRVRAKRRAEAEFTASLVQARQSADPAEAIVLVGDFNALQVNDGFVDLIGTIKGTPTPVEQVVLASSDLVDPDLTDLVEVVPAEERYSFSFDGNAQAIDHVLVNRALLGKVRGLRVARNDADFPESFRNDPLRPERVSDHDAPVAYFRFAKADLDLLLHVAPDPVRSGSEVVYEITLTNEGPDEARAVSLSDTLPSGLAFEALATPEGWSCTTVPLGSAGTLSCTADVVASGESVTLRVSARARCSLVDGSVLPNTASVRTDTRDPEAANDSATVVSAVTNPAPVLTAVTADQPFLWPPTRRLVDVALSYSVNDNCDPTPRCQLSVSSNEPVGGPAGDPTPDWIVIDATHVKLRSERSLMGHTRVYTLGLTCTDQGGATAASTGRVLVQKP